MGYISNGAPAAAKGEKGDTGGSGAKGDPGSQGIQGLVGAAGKDGKSPSAISDITGLQTALDAKLLKATNPPAYTQTFAEVTRTQAAAALATNVNPTLLTEVPALINSTNTAVNEVKKLINALIDDLQEQGILK